MKKNIAIIFGGKSTEHEISILSAMQAMENMDREKYNLLPIYITKDGKWYYGEKLNKLSTYKNFNTKGLKEVAILPYDTNLYAKKLSGYKPMESIDCAFIIMHGMNGEDGSLQGLMELANIPYSSCGILASSIGMSKLAQKIFFTGLEIPVVPYFSITKNQFEKMGEKVDIDKTLFPVIVKPNRLGSSIGISFCKNKTTLKKALNLAFKFDDTVVVEKAIKRLKEVNISALGDSEKILLSETEQPQSNHEILTFQDKYLGGSSKNGSASKGKILCGTKQIKCDIKYEKNSKNTLNFEKNTIKTEKIDVNNPEICINGNVNKQGTKQVGMQNLSRIIPANIDIATKTLVEKYTKIIFQYLECKGVIRIDFIIDEKTKKLYVNEINTIPGSLAFYLWEYKGLDFKNELDKMVEIAIQTNNQKNNLQTTFEQKVL